MIEIRTIIITESYVEVYPGTVDILFRPGGPIRHSGIFMIAFELKPALRGVFDNARFQCSDIFEARRAELVTPECCS